MSLLNTISYTCGANNDEVFAKAKQALDALLPALKERKVLFPPASITIHVRKLNPLDGIVSVVAECDTSKFIDPCKQYHEHNP